MTTQSLPLILFILMRTDLASLNPGKAVIQGTHSANQMVYMGKKSDNPNLIKEVEEWERDAQNSFEWQIELARLNEQGASSEVISKAQNKRFKNSLGFGTGISLGVTGQQLYSKIDLAKKFGFHAGITHDPTYPLVDGATTHIIPLDTCGFIFGRKDDRMSIVTSGLNLMP